VKRSGFGTRQPFFNNYSANGNNAFYFEFNDSNSIWVGDYTTSWQWRLITSAIFRDPSAWYHIVFAFDSAQSTNSNRAKLYVNGSQVTTFSTENISFAKLR
jgi:hypothetical protein